MSFLLSIVIAVLLTTNIEWITRCYRRILNRQVMHPEQQHGSIEVCRLEDECLSGTRVSKKRKDYYRIGLIRGSNRYHYTKGRIVASGTTLVFSHPHVPSPYPSLQADEIGFCCTFDSSFFSLPMREKINALPMFMAGGAPVYHLTDEQAAAAADIFRRMLEELSSDYQYKYDLLRNYVVQLMHVGMKMEVKH